MQEEGQVAMQNLDINEIRVELERFLAFHDAQSTEKDRFDKENKDVLDMLPNIDDLLRDIYDEDELYNTEINEQIQHLTNAKNHFG